MSVNYPRPVFERNNRTSQELAKEQLLTIAQNEDHLLNTRNGSKNVQTARSLLQYVNEGGTLTPKQLFLVDGLFEKTFSGAGYESVNLHIDKKRRQLKF